MEDEIHSRTLLRVGREQTQPARFSNPHVNPRASLSKAVSRTFVPNISGPAQWLISSAGTGPGHVCLIDGRGENEHRARASVRFDRNSSLAGPMSLSLEAIFFVLVEKLPRPGRDRGWGVGDATTTS